MQGSASWAWFVAFVLAACGGRTGLELAPNDAVAGAHAGGSPSTGGAPGAAGLPSAGGVPAQAGGSANGGHAGTSTQSRGGRGAAGSANSHRFATGVSAGTDMTCATERGGSVWCWGSNDRGQLGDGTMVASPVPVRVSGIDDALTVTVGGTWTAGSMGAALSAFACAALRDGTLDCWGNGYGWLPGGTVASSPFPQPISGVAAVTSIAAGNWHLCTLSEGSVSCWGWDRGQLGDGLQGATTTTGPVRVAGLDGAVAISAHGSDFTCAVMPDTSVECWGAVWGPTGLTEYPTPVTVPGVQASSTGLAVGFDHACAVPTTGSPVQCWGANQSGELGDGTANASLTPVTVQGLGGPVSAVAAGLEFTCALLSDGRVQCWGGGAELGAGTVTGSLVPVTVSGLTDAIAISAGYSQACAVTSSGRILCWGGNSDGELGNGDTSQLSFATPVFVSGF